MAYLGDAGERSPPGTTYRIVIQKFRYLIFQPERWLPFIIVVAFLAIWEWQAQTGQISTLFFSAPSAIANKLIMMIMSGDLFVHLSATVSRMLMGFLIGGSVGLILGLLMGWSQKIKIAIDPIIFAIHPIPKIALLPVMLIIFGLGETARVAMVSISTFFPMLISTIAGVGEINPTYYEAARNYGAGKWQLLKRVIIPGSLPLILTGARLALNLALVITIVVEIRFGNEGLGTIIWRSWEILRTEDLYATIAVLSALGMSFHLLFWFLRKRLVPWK